MSHHLNVAISRVRVSDVDGLAPSLVSPDHQQRHNEPEDDAEDGVEEDNDGVLREAVVLGVAELHLGHDDDDQVMTEYIGDSR